MVSDEVALMAEGLTHDALPEHPRGGQASSSGHASYNDPFADLAVTKVLCCTTMGPTASSPWARPCAWPRLLIRTAVPPTGDFVPMSSSSSRRRATASRTRRPRTRTRPHRCPPGTTHNSASSLDAPSSLTGPRSPPRAEPAGAPLPRRCPPLPRRRPHRQAHHSCPASAVHGAQTHGAAHGVTVEERVGGGANERASGTRVARYQPTPVE
ncbi:hypothetical protein FA95DRAFT_1558588 [Auriscalpium vulgare]|uniref:Uncharacterized protein n=1 Tax=Auriscalpium vulgare TaxID=40419 RepID=A0ACB8RUP6_9AGAM|nr:hypothetical protein FA95DRAFT_1558588 [Auriscalpium vulgare]